MFGEADIAPPSPTATTAAAEDGTYRDNSTEAFRAVNCLDYTYHADVAVMREKAAATRRGGAHHRAVLRLRRPRLRQLAVPERARAGGDPRRGRGAHPRRRHHGRPCDPVRMGQALADQLDSGVLVTYEGEGHTAYHKSNACVDDAVEAYLIDGTVPAATRCAEPWSRWSRPKPANMVSRASRFASEPDATPP